jgi:hypothetical protein
MKKVAWFWVAKITFIMVIMVLFTSPVKAQAPFDSTYILGMNWMQADTEDLFFDSMLNCNLYHCHSITDTGFGKTDSVYHDSLFAKGIKSASRMVYTDGGAITRYSNAERFIYQAVTKPKAGAANASDTLRNYYFLSRDKSNGDTSVTIGGLNYWKIDSAGHSDDKCLWNNEFASSWHTQTPGPLKIGVRLNVLNAAPDSLHGTDTVISVILKQWLDTSTYVVLDTFNILWSNCTTSDKIYFSDPITAQSMYELDGFDSVKFGLQLEVHSSRYVTTFLQWVTLEDLYADTLLAGRDLDIGASLVPSIANYTYHQDSLNFNIADSLIWVDSALIHNRFGNKLLYFYTYDEPTMSQYAATARLNQLLDSNRRSSTERQNTQALRYVAQVQPTVFWEGGGFGALAAQVLPDLDSCTSAYAKPNVYVSRTDTSSDTTVHKWDTTWAYSIDTLRKYKANDYGYFPINSGKIVPDSEYALYTKRYHPKSVESFDDYEIREGGFNTELVASAYGASVMSDSAVFFPPSGVTPPKCWWANVFAHAKIQTESPLGGGFYQVATAATPEQMSCISNIALAYGATGLLYFPPVSYDYCDYSPSNPNDVHLCTGFVDNNSRYDSNSNTYIGNLLPTHYKNRTNGLKTFGAWLNTYGKELRTKKWLGAFSRYTHESWVGGYSTKLDTQTIGNVSFIVPSKDSSTRPILKHWPSVGRSYHMITSMSDTLVKDTNDACPHDSLCLVTYGVFKDTVAEKQGKTVLYLYAVNDYCDPRTLLCQFVDSTSSYIKRGERTLWTQLSLDSTVSFWWRITPLESADSTAAEDTILAYNSRLREHFLPGQGRLFRITPYFSVMAGTADETVWNNGRRSDYNGIYHVAVKQNKHISYTRSNANALGYDVLTGFTPATQIDAGVDSAKHPSIRTYDDATVAQMDSVVCVIYEGRKHDAVHNTDTIYVKLALNATDGNDSLGGSYQWKTYTVDSFAIDSHYNSGYEATPVLCPMKIFFGGTHAQDSIKGYVAAWSEGVRGIGMRTFIFNNSTDPTVTVPFGSVVHVDSGVITRSSTFPTIAERAMAGSTVNNDTTDLAYEIDSSGSEIYYRGLFLSAATSGSVYTAAITPQRRECVSCGSHGGCSNVHPNIDVSYTYLYDYVPRVTWEGNETDWEAVNQHLAKLVQRTDVFTAARKTGDWTSFVKLESQQTANRHPSVRVYNYYQGLDTINPNLWAAAPMMMTVPGNGGGGSGLIVDTVTFAQPTQIGWYTNTNRLMMSKTQDGLQHLWPSSAFTRNGYVSFWYAGHWRDSGRTPTLEVNGKTALDPCWNDQREVFFSDMGSHVQIPMQAAYTDDDTVTYYGQIQTFNPSGLCGIINQITNAGATINFVGTSLPLSFRARTDPHLFPTGMLYTDTIYVRPSLDTVSYILQHYPADTTATLAWVAGTGGQIKATLAVRSAATKNILQILDTITYSASHHVYHADTGTVSLASWMDSAVYFTVTVDTTRVTGATITALSVASENGWLDDSDTLLLGKSLGSHPAYVPPAGSDPIGLTIFPNPAKGTASILFSIPVEDASDVTQMNVYDALGRDVTMLVSDVKPAGTHIVEFDGTALPSGRYMVAIKTANHAQAKLMILTK